MSKKYFVLIPLIMASACAYTLEGQMQDLTIRTPGAYDAVCDVYANKIRYKFYPPQTRKVTKSDEDLIIDCKAPGGRDRKVVIEPVISKVAPANAVNGLVPGTMWDYASGALFTYPEVVEVDFRNMLVKPMRPPTHNNPDIKQPEEYELEEFKAGSPRMNSDRYEKEIPLKRRNAGGGFDDMSYNNDDNYSGGYVSTRETQSESGKGDLMRVIDNLGDDLDPSGDSGALVPGE